MLEVVFLKFHMVCTIIREKFMYVYNIYIYIYMYVYTPILEVLEF